MTTPEVAFVVNALATAAGVAVVLAERYSAATPAVCGVAIDVPLIVFVAVVDENQSEVMFTPGAKISTQVPKFAHDALWSVESVADTVMAAAARTGSWKAWLDGYGTTHTDTAYQQVTIPSTAASATLTFWLQISTAETTTTTAFDTLQVQVLDSAGNLLQTLATYSNLNASAGYVQKSFDLSSRRGQTVRIRFVGSEDSSLQTSFLVDDTALNVQ